MTSVADEATFPVLSDEDLDALTDDVQNRIESRIAHLRDLERFLTQESGRQLSRAKRIRVGIILLGALATTQAVSEQFIPFTGLVVFSYTVMTISIAVLGSIDTAFKLGESGTVIAYLRVRCSATVNETDRRFAKDVERVGVSAQALDQMYLLLKKLDQVTEVIENRLAQLGVAATLPDLEPEDVNDSDTSATRQ